MQKEKDDDDEGEGRKGGAWINALYIELKLGVRAVARRMPNMPTKL